MREIKFKEKKFRVWSEIHNTMCDPFSMDWLKAGAMCPNDFDKKGSFAEDAVFLQYSGKKDKNGTEIYDGHIIWRHDCVDGRAIMGFDQVYYNPHTLSWGFLSWNKSFTPFHKWRVEGSSDGGGIVCSNVFDLTKCEVIGNIYQTPELLTAQGAKDFINVRKEG